MKTMKQLLVFFLLLTIHVYAQDNTLDLKPVIFGDCDANGMLVQPEKAPQWKADTLGVENYLNKQIKDKNLRKAKKGKVVIVIIIMPNGKACCSSFLNLTDRDLNPYAFKEAVNAMPDWTPAQQAGKEVKSHKMVVLDIENGKFIAESRK